MPAIRLLWAWRANCITKGTTRPSGESELQEQYRRLSDDELLAIAASGEGFTETARRVTADELKRRGLAGDAVGDYREHLRENSVFITSKARLDDAIQSAPATSVNLTIPIRVAGVRRSLRHVTRRC